MSFYIFYNFSYLYLSFIIFSIFFLPINKLFLLEIIIEFSLSLNYYFLVRDIFYFTYLHLRVDQNSFLNHKLNIILFIKKNSPKRRHFQPNALVCGLPNTKVETRTHFLTPSSQPRNPESPAQPRNLVQ